MVCADAWAQECHVDASGINFGEYNPLGGQSKEVSGEFRVTCKNPSPVPRKLKICIGLREGSAGASITNRRMVSSSNHQLRYQLYYDPQRTRIWKNITGSAFDYWSTEVTIPASASSFIAAVPILYGRILPNQAGAYPGNYVSHYPYLGQIELSYGYTDAPIAFQCDANADYPPISVNNFEITASVPHKCEIMEGPNELDFGTVVGLDVPSLKNAFKMALRCTHSTPYRIELNDGQFPESPGHRRMRNTSNLGHHISYEIFQDPQMSMRWGNTIGGPTQRYHGVYTGNGLGAVYQGYGLVLPQTAPSIGTYRDRVTVTVVF